MRRAVFNKFVASFTALSFILSTVANDIILEKSWAATTVSASNNFFAKNTRQSNEVAQKTDLTELAIPLHLGEIKDISKGKNPRAIIHIQDAHCNYSAQRAIADIIEHLNNTYRVKLVALEGGRGSYDLSIFTGIKNIDTRKKVSDYFVKEGRVNGAEYFAINNPGKAKLYGIEDDDLYFKNLTAYRESLKFKEDIDKGLKILSHIVNNFKNNAYSRELKELDKRIRDYREKKIDFKDYIKYLANKARDYSNSRAQLGAPYYFSQQYPNVEKLVSLLKEEEAIDFKKANHERAALIDSLAKTLSKIELEQLVKKSVGFTAGDITSEDYYSYLFKKAKLVDLNYDNLPNLAKYSDYVSKYDAIDKIKLFEELRILEEALVAAIALTEDQKTIFKLDKNLSILKGMFNISLVKNEYDYYLANKDSFSVNNYLDLVDKKGRLYKLNFKVDDSIGDLDAYLENMAKFYEYSLKRDEAFVRNIDSKLKKEKEDISILVSGGFHAGNLKKLFGEKGYTYIEVMPKIKADNEDNPYFNLLSGGFTRFEEFLIKTISTKPQAANIAIETPFSEMSTDRAYPLPIKTLLEMEAGIRAKTLDGETYIVKISPKEAIKFARSSAQDGGSYRDFDTAIGITLVTQPSSDYDLAITSPINLIQQFPAMTQTVSPVSTVRMSTPRESSSGQASGDDVAQEAVRREFLVEIAITAAGCLGGFALMRFLGIGHVSESELARLKKELREISGKINKALSDVETGKKDLLDLGESLRDMRSELISEYGLPLLPDFLGVISKTVRRLKDGKASTLDQEPRLDTVRAIYYIDMISKSDGLRELLGRGDEFNPPWLSIPDLEKIKGYLEGSEPVDKKVVARVFASLTNHKVIGHANFQGRLYGVARDEERIDVSPYFTVDNYKQLLELGMKMNSSAEAYAKFYWRIQKLTKSGGSAIIAAIGAQGVSESGRMTRRALLGALGVGLGVGSAVVTEKLGEDTRIYGRLKDDYSVKQTELEAEARRLKTIKEEHASMIEQSRTLGAITKMMVPYKVRRPLPGGLFREAGTAIELFAKTHVIDPVAEARSIRDDFDENAKSDPGYSYMWPERPDIKMSGAAFNALVDYLKLTNDPHATSGQIEKADDRFNKLYTSRYLGPAYATRYAAQYSYRGEETATAVYLTDIILNTPEFKPLIKGIEQARAYLAGSKPLNKSGIAFLENMAEKLKAVDADPRTMPMVEETRFQKSILGSPYERARWRRSGRGVVPDEFNPGPSYGVPRASTPRESSSGQVSGIVSRRDVLKGAGAAGLAMVFANPLLTLLANPANAAGISVINIPFQNWQAQAYEDSQGIESVSSSGGKLILRSRLQGAHDNFKKGEAFIDLRYVDIPGLPVTDGGADLKGKKIAVEIEIPQGLAGPESAPNGIQIFLKSGSNWDSCYSSWNNISGRSMTVVFDPNKDIASYTNGIWDTDKASAISQVLLLGVKFAINDASGSSVTYKGPIAIKGVKLIPSGAAVTQPKAEEYTGAAVTIGSFVENSGFAPSWDPGREDLYYGHSFGIGDSSKRISEGGRQAAEAFFKKLHDTGAGATRVFIRCDNRTDWTGVEEDTKVLLETARKYSIRVIPVIYDHLLADSRPELFSDAAKRKDEIARAKRFIADIDRYLKGSKDTGRIIAWDIMNEPEQRGTAEMISFVSELASAVKSATTIPVTTGITIRNTAALKTFVERLGNNLDIIELHWYPDFPALPSAEELREAVPAIGERPVLLGEFGYNSARAGEGFVETIKGIQAKGYKAVIFWQGKWQNTGVGIDEGAYKSWSGSAAKTDTETPKKAPPAKRSDGSEDDIDPVLITGGSLGAIGVLGALGYIIKRRIDKSRASTSGVSHITSDVRQSSSGKYKNPISPFDQYSTRALDMAIEAAAIAAIEHLRGPAYYMNGVRALLELKASAARLRVTQPPLADISLTSMWIDTAAPAGGRSTHSRGHLLYALFEIAKLDIVEAASDLLEHLDLEDAGHIQMVLKAGGFVPLREHEKYFVRFGSKAHKALDSLPEEMKGPAAAILTDSEARFFVRDVRRLPGRRNITITFAHPDNPSNNISIDIRKKSAREYYIQVFSGNDHLAAADTTRPDLEADVIKAFRKLKAESRMNTWSRPPEDMEGPGRASTSGIKSSKEESAAVEITVVSVISSMLFPTAALAAGNSFKNFTVTHPVITAVVASIGISIGLFFIIRRAIYIRHISKICREKFADEPENIFELRYRFILKHPYLSEKVLLTMASQISSQEEIDALNAIISRLTVVTTKSVPVQVLDHVEVEEEFGKQTIWGQEVNEKITPFYNIVYRDTGEKVKSYWQIDSLVGGGPAAIRRMINEELAKQAQKPQDTNRASTSGAKDEVEEPAWYSLAGLAIDNILRKTDADYVNELTQVNVNGEIARVPYLLRIRLAACISPEEISLFKTVIPGYIQKVKTVSSYYGSRPIGDRDFHEGFELVPAFKVTGERLDYEGLYKLARRPADIRRLIKEEAAKRAERKSSGKKIRREWVIQDVMSRFESLKRYLNDNSYSPEDLGDDRIIWHTYPIHRAKLEKEMATALSIAAEDEEGLNTGLDLLFGKITITPRAPSRYYEGANSLFDVNTVLASYLITNPLELRERINEKLGKETGKQNGKEDEFRASTSGEGKEKSLEFAQLIVKSMELGEQAKNQHKYGNKWINLIQTTLTALSYDMLQVTTKKARPRQHVVLDHNTLKTIRPGDVFEMQGQEKTSIAFGVCIQGLSNNNLLTAIRVDEESLVFEALPGTVRIKDVKIYDAADISREIPDEYLDRLRDLIDGVEGYVSDQPAAGDAQIELAIFSEAAKALDEISEIYDIPEASDLLDKAIARGGLTYLFSDYNMGMMMHEYIEPAFNKMDFNKIADMLTAALRILVMARRGEVPYSGEGTEKYIRGLCELARLKYPQFMNSTAYRDIPEADREHLAREFGLVRPDDTASEDRASTSGSEKQALASIAAENHKLQLDQVARSKRTLTKEKITLGGVAQLVKEHTEIEIIWFDDCGLPKNKSHASRQGLALRIKELERSDFFKNLAIRRFNVEPIAGKEPSDKIIAIRVIPVSQTQTTPVDITKKDPGRASTSGEKFTQAVMKTIAMSEPLQEGRFTRMKFLVEYEKTGRMANLFISGDFIKSPDLMLDRALSELVENGILSVDTKGISKYSLTEQGRDEINTLIVYLRGQDYVSVLEAILSRPAPIGTELKKRSLIRTAFLLVGYKRSEQIFDLDSILSLEKEIDTTDEIAIRAALLLAGCRTDEQIEQLNVILAKLAEPQYKETRTNNEISIRAAFLLFKHKKEEQIRRLNGILTHVSGSRGARLDTKIAIRSAFLRHGYEQYLQTDSLNGMLDAGPGLDREIAIRSALLLAGDKSQEVHLRAISYTKPGYQREIAINSALLYSAVKAEASASTAREDGDRTSMSGTDTLAAEAQGLEEMPADFKNIIERVLSDSEINKLSASTEINRVNKDTVEVRIESPIEEKGFRPVLVVQVSRNKGAKPAPYNMAVWVSDPAFGLSKIYINDFTENGTEAVIQAALAEGKLFNGFEGWNRASTPRESSSGQVPRQSSGQASGKESSEKEFWQLVGQVSERTDRDTRHRAAVKLGERGDRRAIPALLGALRYHQLRTSPATIFRSIGDFDTIPEALKKLGATEEEMFEGWFEALNGSYLYCRINACKAFGNMKRPEAAVPLIRARQDKEELVRNAAERGLKQLEDIIDIAWLESKRDALRQMITARWDALKTQSLNRYPTLSNGEEAFDRAGKVFIEKSTYCLLRLIANKEDAKIQKGLDLLFNAVTISEGEFDKEDHDWQPHIIVDTSVAIAHANNFRKFHNLISKKDDLARESTSGITMIETNPLKVIERAKTVARGVYDVIEDHERLKNTYARVADILDETASSVKENSGYNATIEHIDTLILKLGFNDESIYPTLLRPIALGIFDLVRQNVIYVDYANIKETLHLNREKAKTVLTNAGYVEIFSKDTKGKALFAVPESGISNTRIQYNYLAVTRAIRMAEYVINSANIPDGYRPVWDEVKARLNDVLEKIIIKGNSELPSTPEEFKALIGKSAYEGINFNNGRTPDELAYELLDLATRRIFQVDHALSQRLGLPPGVIDSIFILEDYTTLPADVYKLKYGLEKLPLWRIYALREVLAPEVVYLSHELLRAMCALESDPEIKSILPTNRGIEVLGNEVKISLHSLSGEYNPLLITIAEREEKGVKDYSYSITGDYYAKNSSDYTDVDKMSSDLIVAIKEADRWFGNLWTGPVANLHRAQFGPTYRASTPRESSSGQANGKTAKGDAAAFVNDLGNITSGKVLPHVAKGRIYHVTMKDGLYYAYVRDDIFELIEIENPKPPVSITELLNPLHLGFTVHGDILDKNANREDIMSLLTELTDVLEQAKLILHEKGDDTYLRIKLNKELFITVAFSWDFDRVVGVDIYRGNMPGLSSTTAPYELARSENNTFVIKKTTPPDHRTSTSGGKITSSTLLSSSVKKTVRDIIKAINVNANIPSITKSHVREQLTTEKDKQLRNAAMSILSIDAVRNGLIAFNTKAAPSMMPGIAAGYVCPGLLIRYTLNNNPGDYYELRIHELTNMDGYLTRLYRGSSEYDGVVRVNALIDDLVRASWDDLVKRTELARRLAQELDIDTLETLFNLYSWPNRFKDSYDKTAMQLLKEALEKFKIQYSLQNIPFEGVDLRLLGGHIMIEQAINMKTDNTSRASTSGSWNAKYFVDSDRTIKLDFSIRQRDHLFPYGDQKIADALGNHVEDVLGKDPSRLLNDPRASQLWIDPQGISKCYLRTEEEKPAPAGVDRKILFYIYLDEEPNGLDNWYAHGSIEFLTKPKTGRASTNGAQLEGTVYTEPGVIATVLDDDIFGATPSIDVTRKIVIDDSGPIRVYRDIAAKNLFEYIKKALTGGAISSMRLVSKKGEVTAYITTTNKSSVSTSKAGKKYGEANFSNRASTSGKGESEKETVTTFNSVIFDIMEPYLVLKRHLDKTGPEGDRLKSLYISYLSCDSWNVCITKSGELIFSSIFSPYYSPSMSAKLVFSNTKTHIIERQSKSEGKTLLSYDGNPILHMAMDNIGKAYTVVKDDFYREYQNAYKDINRALKKGLPSPGAIDDSIVEMISEKYASKLTKIESPTAMERYMKDYDRQAFRRSKLVNVEDVVKLIARSDVLREELSYRRGYFTARHFEEATKSAKDSWSKIGLSKSPDFDPIDALNALIEKDLIRQVSFDYLAEKGHFCMADNPTDVFVELTDKGRKAVNNEKSKPRASTPRESSSGQANGTEGNKKQRETNLNILRDMLRKGKEISLREGQYAVDVMSLAKDFKLPLGTAEQLLVEEGYTRREEQDQLRGEKLWVYEPDDPNPNMKIPPIPTIHELYEAIETEGSKEGSVLTEDLKNKIGQLYPGLLDYILNATIEYEKETQSQAAKNFYVDVRKFVESLMLLDQYYPENRASTPRESSSPRFARDFAGQASGPVDTDKLLGIVKRAEEIAVTNQQNIPEDASNSARHSVENSITILARLANAIRTGKVAKIPETLQGLESAIGRDTKGSWDPRERLYVPEFGAAFLGGIIALDMLNRVKSTNETTIPSDRGSASGMAQIPETDAKDFIGILYDIVNPRSNLLHSKGYRLYPQDVEEVRVEGGQFKCFSYSSNGDPMPVKDLNPPESLVDLTNSSYGLKLFFEKRVIIPDNRENIQLTIQNLPLINKDVKEGIIKPPLDESSKINVKCGDFIMQVYIRKQDGRPSGIKQVDFKPLKSGTAWDYELVFATDGAYSYTGSSIRSSKSGLVVESNPYEAVKRAMVLADNAYFDAALDTGDREFYNDIGALLGRLLNAMVKEPNVDIPKTSDEYAERIGLNAGTLSDSEARTNLNTAIQLIDLARRNIVKIDNDTPPFANANNARLILAMAGYAAVEDVENFYVYGNELNAKLSKIAPDMRSAACDALLGKPAYFITEIKVDEESRDKRSVEIVFTHPQIPKYAVNILIDRYEDSASYGATCTLKMPKEYDRAVLPDADLERQGKPYDTVVRTLYSQSFPDVKDTGFAGVLMAYLVKLVEVEKWAEVENNPAYRQSTSGPANSNDAEEGYGVRVIDRAYNMAKRGRVLFERSANKNEWRRLVDIFKELQRNNVTVVSTTLGSLKNMAGRIKPNIVNTYGPQVLELLRIAEMSVRGERLIALSGGQMNTLGLGEDAAEDIMESAGYAPVEGVENMYVAIGSELIVELDNMDIALRAPFCQSYLETATRSSTPRESSSGQASGQLDAPTLAISAGPAITNIAEQISAFMGAAGIVGQKFNQSMFRNLFTTADVGQEPCFEFVIGAVPTNENGEEYPAEALGKINGVEAAANALVRANELGNITVSHDAVSRSDIGKMKEAVLRISSEVSKSVPQHRIYCAISKTLLEAIEDHIAKNREEEAEFLMALKAGSVREFLVKNTMLDIVTDRALGNPNEIFPMPYGRVDLNGFARLNLANLLIKGEDGEAYRQAVSLLAHTIGLMTNNLTRINEIETKLLEGAAATDRSAYFIKKTFELALPKCLPLDLDTFKTAWEAEAVALRSL